MMDYELAWNMQRRGNAIKRNIVRRVGLLYIYNSSCTANQAIFASDVAFWDMLIKIVGLKCIFDIFNSNVML
jgi:hypothetical protein